MWNRSHDIVLKHLAADAIIHGEFVSNQNSFGILSCLPGSFSTEPCKGRTGFVDDFDRSY